MAAVDQRGDGGQPDRPAPEHGHRLAGPHLGLVGGVHADGERFGEGGHVEREVVGHRVQPPVGGLHQQEGGEPALAAASADAVELVHPRLHDHPVADPVVADLGADPVDGAGQLVAQAHRLGARPRDSTQCDGGEVGAADAARRHPHEGVGRPGLGVGDLVDPDVAGTVDSHLLHVPS